MPRAPRNAGSTSTPGQFTPPDPLSVAAERFIEWLTRRIASAARGDDIEELQVEPRGAFWLGRLAAREAVVELGLGERGERLDPCATGMRLLLDHKANHEFLTKVTFRLWLRKGKASEARWIKTDSAIVEVPISLPDLNNGERSFGAQEFQSALTTLAGEAGLSAEIRITKRANDQSEVTIEIVNTSPKNHDVLKDTNLYEVSLEVSGVSATPFVLEALPDSFRYDRKVVAYGNNCGVAQTAQDQFQTVDLPTANTRRPSYWSLPVAPPDLTFRTLSTNPIPSLERLATELRSWGSEAWGDSALSARGIAEGWNPDMREQANQAASEFWNESERIEEGLALLTSNKPLLKAFQLMNEAMEHAAGGRYAGWRSFQIGFLLANLASIAEPEKEAPIADIVWFATGGGKTETYLGLLVLAGLFDRMSGKSTGVTGWSRFPLRMLSLQQTQRFANAMAGAELARRREGIEGDPFSVGFLVGQGATPNRIALDPDEDTGQPNPDDPAMPRQYKVLLSCPFCQSSDVDMGFNRRQWRLEHRCTNDKCPWPEEHLPFYVVDDEIYRFLPTVIVGTLDKAASISLQAAMRGLVGPPHGICSVKGHGYVYSSRSDRPNGCLVPGCPGDVNPLPMEKALYGPSFRLQDELHLLRDSLGAVDAHYESLLDHLELTTSNRVPKVLASSATLAGYQKQVRVLYNREARVFPTQGPSVSEGFWSSETPELMRTFLAVAPRGVTLEFATDRLLTELQTSVRALKDDPERVCKEIGIDSELAPELLSLYGTNVVYGNTLRDLDAVTRSMESQQVGVSPLNFGQLTGRTPFEEVRQTLQRLEQPESKFTDRLHVITASSMMSHGVDIDRLNVMVMLGLPLSTAEFIQTTSRVGRRRPGLIFVMHKIARERDAALYRSFEQYVHHGDRFVESVPITRRSRRVLERTVAGLELARILNIHEPQSGRALSTVRRLREYFTEAGVTKDEEESAIQEALYLNDELDGPVKEELQDWFERFFFNLENPGGTFRWPSDLAPFGPPMRSLRDVEEQAPIRN